jgi:hypothetical protein
MFALNSTLDVIEPFEIYQSFQTIPLGKAIDESRTMLEHTAHKIICHANVQDAAGTVGQNVDVSTCHTDILQDVDGRDEPGHDELRDICRLSLGMRSW